MNIKVFIVSGLVSLFLFGCVRNGNKEGAKDDILTGEIVVSVDETILPLFEEQKEVFESSYYNAKIVVNAAPEVQAVNALLKGEAHTAFLARNLSADEAKHFKERSIDGRVYPAAYDAIVAVANVAQADTSIVVSDILSMIRGEQKTAGWNKLVFDNLNSSVLRYFMESAQIAKPAPTYIEGMKSGLEVLEAVSQSEDKIGFISFNQYLSLKSSFSGINKIRILSVLNEDLDKYVLPSQASLSTDEYPLKRTIYILNYQPNLGLGLGFSAFVTGDRGQRIVLKAGLLPATMPGREIIVRDGLNL